MNRHATIVEVGPRDGFQSIPQVIPTATKIDLIKRLHAAGIRRAEVTAFVSPKAVPQLADAGEVLDAIAGLEGMDAQVLVPNLRNTERALAAGARHLAFVLSVSEKHNLGNVKRLPSESAKEYAEIVAMLPAATKMRLNVATAFDCPFDGAMDPAQTLDLLDILLPVMPDAEICLCDTTGRVTPDRVSSLLRDAKARFPGSPNWAYHGHDTYGLGVANAIAAVQAGVTVIDAAFAGLGGCPFAPGATGNVATEDVVWAFAQMGIDCGIALDKLLDAARLGADLPGGLSGGRVRAALEARLCLERGGGE